jgi:predicted PurR-regulated permease PerM
MVGWRITLWAVIVVAALAFLYMVRGILLPFVVAFVIAALLDPTIKRLRVRGFSRPFAVGIVFVAFFGALVAATILLTPIIRGQLANVSSRLDYFSSQLSSAAAEQNIFLRWNPTVQVRQVEQASPLDRLLQQNRATLERLGLPTTSQAIVEQYLEPQKRNLAIYLQNFFNSFLAVVGAFGSQVLLLLFTPLFVLLMLLDLESFKRRSATWIPPSIRADTLALLSDVGQVFVRYLRGVTVVVLWYILVASVLLTLLGAPYSILLAIVFALVYLIPYVGPVANAFMLFLITGFSGTTGNLFFDVGSPWGFAAIISLIYFGIMLLFDPLVYTRVVGSSVGLHPVVSFFVVFSGGALFGAVGMLLAFPVAGAVKVILDRLLRVTSTSHETLALPAIPLRHRTGG